MKVCQKLEAAGFEKVVNVDGGTSAWLDANLPSVTGKKAISLKTGAYCRGFAGRDWSSTWSFCSSRLVWFVCLRWGGVDICRNYRYLRNGYAHCPNALEPGVIKLPDFHWSLGDGDLFSLFC